jgi:hypothetical protein
MDLKEIINRPNEQPIQEDEAYFLIKTYVKERKGVDIEPKINAIHFNIFAQHEISLLHHMLNIIIDWYKSKNDEI